MLKAMMVLAAVAAAVPATAPMRHLSPADKTFLMKAAMGNNYEIKAAQMAQSMATNDADKQFAAMMIADHGKLGASVKHATDSIDATFKLPEGVDAKQQAMLDSLMKSGKSFSAEYKKQMLATHAQTLAMFKAYAADGESNAAIKKIISGAVPTVQMHWDKAKALPGS